MKLTFGAAGCTDAAARMVFCGWEPYDPAWGGRVQTLKDTGRFHPETAQVKLLDGGQELLILIGRPEKEDVRHVRQLIGRGVRMAREEKVGTLEIDLDSWHGTLAGEILIREAALAAWEGNYVFEAYRSAKTTGLEQVVLKCSHAGEPSAQSAFALGDLLGQAVADVRGVVNRTSRDMTPQALTDWILERGKDAPYEIEVVEQKDLEEAGVKALLNVAAGSMTPARMVILRYRGDRDHPERITALLGKGITYDSGGLGLKSKVGMITMHHDMGGAAAAAGAFDAVARMGISINLTAVLPVCENMPSPVSYRQGDVIGTMNGKSVLIKSTDAEGRLVLADAATWAIRKEQAERLVDIATLTGGAVSAYGPLINAVAVEDAQLRQAVYAASETSGELVWEMPLLEDYYSYLKSEHADLANSSNGAGSAMINGALFIKAFTENRPWLHIDSAGTSWTDKTVGCMAYGATGAGTVLLYDLICRLAQQDQRRMEAEK